MRHYLAPIPTTAKYLRPSFQITRPFSKFRRGKRHTLPILAFRASSQSLQRRDVPKPRTLRRLAPRETTTHVGQRVGSYLRSLEVDYLR